MQEEGIGRRRMAEIALAPERHAGLADTRGEVGTSEVEGAVVTQRLAGGHEQVDQAGAVPRRQVTLEITDAQGRRLDGGALAGHAGGHQVAVGVDDRRPVGARGPEIEQAEGAGRRIVAIVGEVGVGLDQSELEQLAEQQREQPADDAVALVRRAPGEALDRRTGDEGHAQDVVAAQRLDHFGQHEAGAVAEEGAEARDVPGLAPVVGLGMQLVTRLGQQGRDVESRRQEP